MIQYKIKQNSKIHPIFPFSVNAVRSYSSDPQGYRPYARPNIR